MFGKCSPSVIYFLVFVMNCLFFCMLWLSPIDVEEGIMNMHLYGVILYTLMIFLTVIFIVMTIVTSVR